MAHRVQQAHHLRCTHCDGYGFKPVISFIDRGRQVGEETCPRCRGDGTKRHDLTPVQIRSLPRQKNSSLKELEQEIQRLAGDHDLHFRLGFNEDEDAHYDDHIWLDDAERDKAISEDSVWTIEIFGDRLRASFCLAASSLPTLMQMVAQYELQPVGGH